MAPFYRPEAVKHASQRLSGSVMLAAPPAWRVLSYSLALLVVGASALISQVTCDRKERVSGWLQPPGGIIRIDARAGGIIQAIKVKEGDVVRSGGVIALIKTSTGTSDGDSGAIQEGAARMELAASSSNAQAKIDKAWADCAQWKRDLENLRAQRGEAEKSLEVAIAEVEIAKSSASRAERLQKQGYMAQKDVESAQAGVFTMEQAVSAAKQSALQLDNQISALSGQIAQTPNSVRQIETQSTADKAQLAEKIQQVAAGNIVQITAPITGRIVAIPSETGTAVLSSSAVAVITPLDSEMDAELLVPSRAAGFIKAGQDVWMQYQAFPYQKFGSAHATITTVSKTVLAPSEIAVAGLSPEEPVFRVKAKVDHPFVVAYGEKTSLQPGMLLNASIIVERRSLLEWMLDPVYAVARR